jgi:hypothetical protein
MKRIAIVLVLALVGCTEDQAAPIKNLSYQELKDLPTDCQYADQQLATLRDLQKLKNYDSDPDKLTEYARSYNGLLKAKIWWYAYACAKS